MASMMKTRLAIFITGTASATPAVVVSAAAATAVASTSSSTAVRANASTTVSVLTKTTTELATGSSNGLKVGGPCDVTLLSDQSRDRTEYRLWANHRPAK